MKEARLIIDRDQVISKIDNRLYGSFIEHVGRAVYGGIYDAQSNYADQDGFRRDVLELVRELKIPVVRYPGGNFVSGYRWEDGIGSKENRPVRRELAWKSIETNEIGVDEFAKWCRLAGADLMMAVNLGTRGAEDACNLLEYCNLPGGTFYSDLRIKNGTQTPHGVKMWCLGNEMDGPWQIGHKTALEYGRLACETARAMRMLDSELELIACGSSMTTLPTFPQWEADVLDQTYEQVDFISLHQYYGNRENDFSDYMAQSMDMEKQIKTVASVCDYIKAKKRSTKTMKLSFDEWNVWFHSTEADENINQNSPWQKGPALLEDLYTLEDALVVGCLLITLMRNADRVKTACLAQLVNAIAPIMTQPGGVAWRQPIFYPFLHASRYGRGSALNTTVICDKYDSKNYTDVPVVDSMAVWNEEARSVAVFAVNRDAVCPVQLSFELNSFGEINLSDFITLNHSDVKAVNGPQRENVIPAKGAGPVIDGGRVEALLPPASWNVLRFSIK